MQEDFRLPLEEPPGPDATFTPAVVDPDLVARRPDDLVLLGVRWNDGVEMRPGPPAELVAHAGAELTVTMPPQHTAEEVVAAEGDIRPVVDPQFTGGVPVWRSSCRGSEPGRRRPRRGEPVAAHRGGRPRRVASTDARAGCRPDRSAPQLELPYRLLMTPFRTDGGAITLDHHVQAALGPGEAVGLWNTRVAADGADPTAPAGLTLRPLGADIRGPFRTSLSGGMRGPHPDRGAQRHASTGCGSAASALPSRRWRVADVRVGPRRHAGP